MVDVKVVGIWCHKPETHAKRGQILADSSNQWRIHKAFACKINRFFDSVCGRRIILRDVTPNVEKIVERLGCKPITRHALRLSASHTRFFASID